MSPVVHAAHAVIRILLAEVAPKWRAECDADPNTAADPGLRAATSTVKRWLADLRRRREAALQSDRLSAALRGAFVVAVGRDRICVPAQTDLPCCMETSPVDMPLVETMRELAETLDAARGTTVARQFDARCENLLKRAFEFAERAGEESRGRRSRR